MMRRVVSRRRRLSAIVVVLAVAAPGVTTATDMDWWSVDGGGGRSAGSGFALTGTIGQADAGQPVTGGAFTFAGGLWTGDPTPAEPPLFADDFETNDLSLWSWSVGGTAAAAPGDQKIEGRFDR